MEDGRLARPVSTEEHVAADALVRRAVRSAAAPRTLPGRGVRGYVVFLPAYFLAFILLVEPLLQRREIFEHCAGVHLAPSGQNF